MPFRLLNGTAHALTIMTVSDSESLGCCGLRRPRKSAKKPEEPKQEEQQPEEPEPEPEQEAKVTCCGMKKSSPAVDEELEAIESSEQATEPQKLEPIKEESTTGSEQLKRDSSSESQEVQQAETK
jgi:hypothetical protein